jgi:hypothetical protein
LGKESVVEINAITTNNVFFHNFNLRNFNFFRVDFFQVAAMTEINGKAKGQHFLSVSNDLKAPLSFGFED